jgi:amino acid adenylation domain-containing protein
VLYPDKVVFASDEGSITYAAFVRAARKVGSQLPEKSRVAILIDRSVSCLIAIFGVAYANGCCAVLDMESPAERSRKILDTFAPDLCLTDQRNVERAREICGAKAQMLEELLQAGPNDHRLSGIFSRMIDTDPFLVIFTSGSTGSPKGTVICHRSLIDYIEAACDTLGIDSHVVWGNQAQFFYSMCVLDVYSTVAVGATLRIIPKRCFSFPGLLIDYLNEHRINSVYWVPPVLTAVALMDTFSEYLPRYLERVFFVGEVMPVRHLNYWIDHLSDCVYANLYGPTEITDTCTYYIVDRHFEDHESLPIGTPFKNCEVIVIDDNGKRVLRPEDGEGVLYVRGSFLGLGYYGEPEKTRQSFVQNPLNSAYPELLYRTGDYVCFNEQGELMYRGRADHQIKHMGYRIELGEIENAAASVPGVDHAVCIYDSEKRQIILFYAGKMEDAALRSQLLSRLPAYMMPARFLHRETLPMMSTGKTDRVKLAKLYRQAQ